jgi:hypothetical protein
MISAKVMRWLAVKTPYRKPVLFTSIAESPNVWEIPLGTLFNPKRLRELSFKAPEAKL